MNSTNSVNTHRYHHAVLKHAKEAGKIHLGFARNSEPTTRTREDVPSAQPPGQGPCRRRSTQLDVAREEEAQPM